LLEVKERKLTGLRNSTSLYIGGGPNGRNIRRGRYFIRKTDPKMVEAPTAQGGNEVKGAGARSWGGGSYLGFQGGGGLVNFQLLGQARWGEGKTKWRRVDRSHVHHIIFRGPW